MDTQNQKPEAAAFVPYRKKGDSYEFFLQMRTKDAPSNPGVFGFFGGGLEEGETPEIGVRREIAEELVYEPNTLTYVGVFEINEKIVHMYIEEVDNDFESQIKVREGEYGKFLTSQDLSSVPSSRGVTHAVPKIVQKISQR